jgi:NADH-quinone oxidoreductase subunit H
MTDAIDQIFVTSKHWLEGLFPPRWHPTISIALTVLSTVTVFGTLFAIATVLERKGLGRMQNRYGPNRVGVPFANLRLFGFGQPIADGIKALIKEDIVPQTADKVLHFLAPIALLVPVLLTFAVLPYGRNMVPVNLDAGVLYFFAVGAGTELAVFMAGWSSRNKYSLLGAMRAIAQMLSYEVPLILSTVAVLMIGGSLSTVKIVEAQNGYVGWLPRWFVFTPWGLEGFLIFVVAATAESNRTPFDLPEGESEIVAGYFTEYSGFKFALFFLAEYLEVFAVSGMAATLFLGGYGAPLPWLTWIPSWFWFMAKVLAFLALFIWLRGTLPRLRVDQLMNFAWRFLVPMALINVVVAGVWHFMGGGAGRWFVCPALIVAPYVWLGLGLFKHEDITKRAYRYAE